MAAAAAPLSIASAGFGAASSIAQGRGNKAAADAAASRAEFDAQRAERAAEFGRINADQTDAFLREELATTLSNIDAIRASSGIAPGSPTGTAVKEEETRISDRQRRARIATIRQQVLEDEATAGYDRSVAAYQRSVGKQAMKLGYLGAAGKIAGGIAQGFGGR